MGKGRRRRSALAVPLVHPHAGRTRGPGHTPPTGLVTLPIGAVTPRGASRDSRGTARGQPLRIVAHSGRTVLAGLGGQPGGREPERERAEIGANVPDAGNSESGARGPDLLRQLREARLYLGLTRLEAARALRVSAASIRLWEAGRREVSPGDLLRLARLYRTTPGALLGEAPVADPAREALYRRTGELSQADRWHVLRFAEFLGGEAQARGVREAGPPGGEPDGAETRVAPGRWGTPPPAAVDIYGQIHRAGLWLMFQPLDRLLGLYQRAGEGGIVVNLKVHPALQRFTAAHEFGHHVLGHDLGLDPAGHIEGPGHYGRQERQAQRFAAVFLMPERTVARVARSLGISRGRVTADGAYQLALRLGTSYLATLSRLRALGWLGRGQYPELRAVRPRTIKHRLTSRLLTDPKIDVWTIGPHTRSIWAREDDALRLSLPENPSTGYRWQLELPRGLGLQIDEFSPPGPALGTAARSPWARSSAVGGEGVRTFELRAGRERGGVFHCRLARPWRPDEVREEFGVLVRTSRRPRRGLYSEQRREVAA